MAKRESKLASKIPIDMTPMIDVVFQLLTFFMLTLKTVVVEGDFNIRMPLGASAVRADDVPIPPLVLKMTPRPRGGWLAFRWGASRSRARTCSGSSAAPTRCSRRPWRTRTRTR